MKKQILVFTMCLTLTSNIAFADGAKPVSKNINAQTTRAKLNKPAESSPITIQEAKKRFEERKMRERELLYTALEFSAEQKTKAEAIDEKVRTEAKIYLKKIQSESKKLRDLKNNNASCFAIYMQKRALKSAKCDADKFFADSRKSFESILTKEQLEKFNTIEQAKKMERQQLKKNYKKPKCHKHIHNKYAEPGYRHMESPKKFENKKPCPFDENES